LIRVNSRVEGDTDVRGKKRGCVEQRGHSPLLPPAPPRVDAVEARLDARDLQGLLEIKDTHRRRVLQ